MQKALCAAQPLLVNTVWRTITDRLLTWTHAQDAAELIENMSVEELQELRSMRNKQRIMWLIDALMRAGEISFGKRHNHSILNAIKGVRLLFAIYRDYDLHEAFYHLNSQVMPAS